MKTVELDGYEIVLRKSPTFYDGFFRKDELQHQTHYCPGCGHGVAHKLIGEALTELDLQERAIVVSPVGCSVFAYYYFDTGNVQAAHGRAPAVATALKRANPESIVISYQGDGDLAAIGTAEIVHAANRGENICVFFVNNSIYGMTGGQMAPTTLVGQTSTTSPWGRRANNEGFPIKMAEMLSTLEAPVYIERVSLGDTKNILKARKAVRKALELQKNGAGFSMVEILSPCPTIMKMDPVNCRNYVNDALTKAFPLGVYRDRKPDVPFVAIPQKPVAEVLGIKSGRPTADEKVTRRAHTKPTTIKVAGFGGQGVLLLGQLIAEMGMREHMEVAWLPSYGPEMRSGSAHCHVTLSHDRIGTPLIASPDVVIAMNEISLKKFAPQVAPGGVIFYNRDRLPEDFTPAKGVTIVCMPASEIADQIGSAKVANVVMLGAMLEEIDCLPFHTAMEVIKGFVKNEKLLDFNKKALEAGRRFVDEHILVGAVSQPDGFSGEPVA
jgi:2-oxoisovalerate ferredoxin oxidoreductase beta subunit